MAELVDALDSKSSSARSAGSIPARGTTHFIQALIFLIFCLFLLHFFNPFGRRDNFVHLLFRYESSLWADGPAMSLRLACGSRLESSKTPRYIRMLSRVTVLMMGNGNFQRA